MKTKLSELVKLSNFYGKNKDFVIGGGGNSSFKDKNFIQLKNKIPLTFYFSIEKNTSTKKTSPAVFTLFAKKARPSLGIKLEKFVYTKTHLAIKIGLFFQSSEK